MHLNETFAHMAPFILVFEKFQVLCNDHKDHTSIAISTSIATDKQNHKRYKAYNLARHIFYSIQKCGALIIMVGGQINFEVYELLKHGSLLQNI